MEWIIFLASVLNLFLALFVWVRNPKNVINYSFGIFGIIAALLTFFDFLFRFLPNLLILRTTYAFAALLPAAASIWIFRICKINLGKYSVLKHLFLLIPGIVFFIFSYIDGFIVEEIYYLSILGYKGGLGPVFPIYSIYFLIYTTLLTSLLYYTQRKASALYKIQIRFVLFGIASYSLLAIFFSLILPTFFNNYNFTLLDAPSSIFFVGFTAYAITRYRLMDIRAIIFRTIGFGFVLLLITSVFSIISAFISRMFVDLIGIKSNIIAGLVIALLVTLFYQSTRRFIERVTNTFLYKKSYDPDALLSAINETTSSILNIDQLLNGVSKILFDAFHCEKIGVALLNGKNKLKVTYKDGFKPGVAEALVSFPNIVKIMFKQFKETPGIFVVDERKTQFDNGEFKPVSPKLLFALFESDLALIVPLYVKEKLLGVLVIGTKKSGDPYASRDINVLNIISGQFAIAIDRAQLYGHLEELVEERTEQLHEANKKLSSANVQLKKLDASKSDFISIASHQLRTPLTAVKGWISMINDGDLGPLPPKYIRPMKVVYASNERLIILVNDLLNISRIESGRQTYNFKENDLAAIADEVVTKLQIQADVKSLKLVFEKPQKGFPKVVCDSERIHEVMMNFVDNAIKYTKKGSVAVRLEAKPENMVTFSVKDTGMGISKEVMPFLFKKFSRGEGSFLVHTEGVGLGLYVAKLNIEVHESKFLAESEGVDKGSTFSFTIPIAGPKKLPYEAPDAKK